ncbi:hypothetical protein CDD83_6586 [Cordyceps sp. RAO-2017]|nr:hypothetical protein CDD83_6586 [Cordyceps sp. RAO-2017]
MRGADPRRVGFICDSCAFVRIQLQPLRAPWTSRFTSPRAQQTCKSVNCVPSTIRWTSAAAATAEKAPVELDVATKRQAVPPAVKDAGELARATEKTRDRFLAVDGIPTPQFTRVALQECLRAAASIHPQLKRAEAQSRASASRLVTLGAERTGTRLPIDPKLQDASNRISQSAYVVITHPNVEMKPEFLELYVQIQAQLGRPESLPSVLELFATKPKPTVKDGKIQYIRRNPNMAMRAVEAGVADLALQTAIEAKNLDAALGIIEASYAMTAFKRQKLLKNATAPAIGVSTLPFGIFGLASGYAAYWQNTMDITTATGLGFTGISCYFLAVGSLGMIAKLSNKDQMKRVTWTPGTPLRYRWLREEERAALDKVACAWGFKETWRHGEETGAEWEGLREYLGYRQMLLDRIEFMEGMT